MERLRGVNLQSGIHKSLLSWHEAILKVQEKRRQEVINSLPYQGNLPANHLASDQNLLTLSSAMRVLVNASRRARSSLFCALTLTTLFNLDPVLASSEKLTDESLDSVKELSGSSEAPTVVINDDKKCQPETSQVQQPSVSSSNALSQFLPIMNSRGTDNSEPPALNNSFVNAPCANGSKNIVSSPDDSFREISKVI